MSYPYSHSDLELDPVSMEYKFKHVNIDKKAYDLIRRMICDKKDRVRVWLHDVSGVRHEEELPPEEIAMISGMFNWGFYDWDSDENDFTKVDLGPCACSWMHEFERKAYTTWFFRECTKCGYSPEFDYNKPEFRQCHIDFIEWEAKNKS